MEDAIAEQPALAIRRVPAGALLAAAALITPVAAAQIAVCGPAVAVAAVSGLCILVFGAAITVGAGRALAVIVGLCWAGLVVGDVASWLGGFEAGGLDGGDAAGLAAGAAGLLAATCLGLLGAADRARTEAAMRAAVQTAHGWAVRDSLSGCANRRGLEMIAVPMVENARREGQAVHCLFVDVDEFQAVNDAHGLRVADDLLVVLADALRASIRATDVIGRWAGDQFVVVGPGTGTSPIEMERRVRAQLSAMPLADGVLPPRVSVGSATLVPWDDGDLDSLIRRASQDMALRRTLRRQATLGPLPGPALPRRTEPTV